MRSRGFILAFGLCIDCLSPSGARAVGNADFITRLWRWIMLAMFDDHDKVFKSICAGASGYLLKTAAPEKITEAIQEVLAGGAPKNARVAKSVLDMFAKLAAPQADYGLTGPRKRSPRIDGARVDEEGNCGYHVAELSIGLTRICATSIRSCSSKRARARWARC